MFLERYWHREPMHCARKSSTRVVGTAADHSFLFEYEAVYIIGSGFGSKRESLSVRVRHGIKDEEIERGAN